MSKFDPYEHLRLRLNPDGTVTRLITYPPSDPNPDPDSGDPVITKDAVLNPQTKTTLRIYFPIQHFSDNNNKNKNKTARRLPITLYFEGCSWVQFPANNPALNSQRQDAALAIPTIIIHVTNRLAPESRLPAQYQDALDALQWLKKQASDPHAETWLIDHGDFTRCYLAGAGNGANIVYNAALLALDLDLYPVKIAGLFMNQPLFGGQKRTQSELRYATDTLIPLPVLDLAWELALPKGTNRDHRYCNPMLDGPHKSKLKLLPRCLVTGFGMDPLFDRQQEFVQMLIKNGVRVEAHFDKIGFHRIEVVDPRRYEAISQLFREFIYGG